MRRGVLTQPVESAEYARWFGGARRFGPRVLWLAALHYATLMALPLTFVALGSQFAAFPLLGGVALEVLRSTVRRGLKRQIRANFMSEAAREALDKRALVPEADVESAFWAAYLLERSIAVDAPALLAATFSGASILMLAAPAVGISLTVSLVTISLVVLGFTVLSSRWQRRAADVVVEYRQQVAAWLATAERDSGEIYGLKAREPFLGQLDCKVQDWTQAENRLELKRLQQRLLVGALFLAGVLAILRSQHINPLHLQADHSLSVRGISGLLVLSTGIPICYVFAQHAESLLTAHAWLVKLVPPPARAPGSFHELGQRAMQLTARALGFSYPGSPRRPALRALDFDIDLSKLTLIVAPNGAGKTTLARLICGVLVPDQGTLQINGIACSEISRDEFGFVPQNPLMVETLSIEENVRFVAPDASAQAISELLAELGLQRPLAQLAGELSRGEQRRVAVARAILKRPRLLLLDEPDVWLDAQGRARLACVLDRQLSERAVVVVSHRKDWLHSDLQVIDLQSYTGLATSDDSFGSSKACG